MERKSRTLIDYWLENKDSILTVNQAAKILYDSNCSSNRKKAKVHLLTAKESIEKDHGQYVYSLFDGKRVLGYKVVTNADEYKTYSIDYDKMRDARIHYEKKECIGKANLIKQNLPFPALEYNKIEGIEGY